MKKIISVLLMLSLCLGMAGCFKSEQAQQADDLLSTLFPVTLESEDAILKAEEAVNALSEKQRGKLDNLDLLQKAKDEYQKLVDELNRSLAGKIDALIEAIGEVTLDSGSAIEAAAKAYDSAAPEVQAFVTLSDTLTEASQAFDDLRVQNMEEVISAIGEVTLESEDAIEAAQEMLAELPDALQEQVSNTQDLLDAAETWKEIKHQALVDAATQTGRERLRVTQFYCSEPDTAGGVELYFNFVNRYWETIEKVEFGVSFYNESGNLVMDKYRQQQVYLNTQEGPFSQWCGRYDDSWYFGKYYTGEPVTPVLTSLVITYTNGDQYTMSPLELEAIIY